MKNFHSLSIPVEGSHTGELHFEVVQELHKAAGGEMWRFKLLSVATDVACNMTGRLQGAVTRFENATLPGFYRIWCGADQLDLIMKCVMSGCLKQAFRASLFSLISFLGRQFNLRQQMGSTCLAASTTRLYSLGGTTKWLVRNRENVADYVGERNPVLAPTPA